MTARISEIIGALDKFAPPHLAAEWDRVGLQIGNPDAEVEKLLLTLDVLPDVVEEAHARGATLIVSHHPVIRTDFPGLVPADPAGRVLLSAARAGISIFVAHTNLDKAKGGVSDALAEALGLRDVEILLPEEEVNTYKLAVFVPEDSVAAVIEALSKVGAGMIGNYTHCTFRSPGWGTFKPELGAKPSVGKIAEINEVKEYRLEAVVPGEKLGAAIAALIKAHPYEEVAYDVYQRKNPSVGFGRIGDLEKELTLAEFLLRCKEKLDVQTPRVAGDPEQKVKKVAVVGGGGGTLIQQAKRKGADAYVTGDIKYHEAQLARGINLALIDAGHYHTEKLILPRLAALFEKAGLSVEIMISQTLTDAWKADNRW